MTHMKLCAKSKGVAPDRLVQLMRESKKTDPAVMDNAATSGAQESTCSSSSRMEGGEGEGERGELLQARRSKRLVGQSGKGGSQGKGVEATTILPRGDEDFAMPPPVSRPAGRKGRKRKRDNLQDKLVPCFHSLIIHVHVHFGSPISGSGLGMWLSSWHCVASNVHV